MTAEPDPLVKGEPLDPEAEDHFLRRHLVFTRRARDISHQALFFLGLLYDATSAKAQKVVDAYRPFALEQVRSLYEGARPPEPPQQVDTERFRRALALHTRWRDLGETLAQGDVRKLRKAFQEFLDKSRSGGLFSNVFVHGIPDVYTYFRKNLALIWGAVILFVVLSKVEAVNSLLRNEADYNPAGLLLPLTLLLVPLSVSRIWTLALRLQNKVPFWDLASSAFRSFHHQALEPGRLIDRWSRKADLRREIVMGQAVKLLVYVLWWVLAFALFYYLNSESKLGPSGSSLTVFMVLSLCYAVLLLAHIVDLWEYLDPRPVRFLMLLVFLLGFIALLTGLGREYFFLAFLLFSAGYFYGWSRDRQSTLRLVLGIFFLLLAGANLRGRYTDAKAAWPEGGTSAPWQRLEVPEWPWPGDGPVVVLAASGGGSRAAIYTGLLLQKLNQEGFQEIASHLQAISSVSGGSLANAAYIARLLDLREGRQPDRAAALRNLDEAMSRDFLFPTLVGALVPRTTRGQAIESTWEENDGREENEVGLGTHRLSELAREWREAKKTASQVPPFPIPLFNSTTLDGHDLVISPLERRLYSADALEDQARSLNRPVCDDEDGDKAEAGDPCTWVYYRDGIYALEDLLPDFDPRLSQAVRASANFPFGFPLVRILTDRPLFFNPKDQGKGTKRVQLTDGGALSNSGMWSLYHLLMPDEKDKLEELKRRGVLLLVVEASKMPEYPNLEQSLNTLWSTIGDQGPVGQRLHRQMFDALGLAYGDRIAILQWDLRARENYNVLTSWALGEDSIQKLRDSFKVSWNGQKRTLMKAWKVLRREAPGDGKPIVATRRPPLD